MSANFRSVLRDHLGKLYRLGRCISLRWGARAFLISLLLVVTVRFSPLPSQAQTTTLTVVDNEPVDTAPGEPGPGDNMVFSVRRNATYVVSLAFTTGQPGEIVSHRLSDNGELELVGRTPAGPEPRAIAMARNGDYAVLVNSIANEVVVMSIGDDGLLKEVSRTSSGGLNPYDVAVGFNDIVVVANRDSDQINTFHIDRKGRLSPLAQAAAGIDPHVVSVSSRGFVAVCNQTGRSVSLFEIDRRGELTFQKTLTLDNMIPRTATWHDRQLFVALDVEPFPADDVIRPFSVDRNGEVTQGVDTPAGVFLTDIEANEDGLFAVTANRNDPTTPLDDRDEVRAYGIDPTSGLLTLVGSAQTPAFPPSFKQVSTGPDRWSKNRHVIVSEFQSGWLRSLLYRR